ncbi:MAG: hypothetical protein HC895_21050 [Leptolyngbyaceae cyanobacterium SM1_3_5]|nr:hypothetical protein [Leptolyngbyaceae cyanobacterium SM1_3_5]
MASSARSILTLPAGFVGNLAIVPATELITTELITTELIAIVEPELNLELLQRSDEQLMQAVLNHDRVLRELFEQTTLLPLRFGTCFVSEAGLVEHLQTHQQAYQGKLAALSNQVEYSLKCSPIFLPEAAIDPDLKGKDYFLAKNSAFGRNTAAANAAGATAIASGRDRAVPSSGGRRIARRRGALVSAGGSIDRSAV